MLTRVKSFTRKISEAARSSKSTLCRAVVLNVLAKKNTKKLKESAQGCRGDEEDTQSRYMELL